MHFRSRDRKKKNNFTDNSNFRHNSNTAKERNSKSPKKLNPVSHSGYGNEKRWKKLKKSKDDYSKLEINPHDSESKADPDPIYSFSELKNLRHVPWMSKKTSEISATLVRAHNEIIEFVNYLGPTNQVHTARENSFEKYLIPPLVSLQLTFILFSGYRRRSRDSTQIAK